MRAPPSKSRDWDYKAFIPGGPVHGTEVNVITQLPWSLDEFWPNGNGIAHAKNVVH